jgi:hypothetical protein
MGAGLLSRYFSRAATKSGTPQQRAAFITLWQVGDEGPGGKSG